jgi:hypothetical protein
VMRGRLTESALAGTSAMLPGCRWTYDASALKKQGTWRCFGQKTSLWIRII